MLVKNIARHIQAIFAHLALLSIVAVNLSASISVNERQVRIVEPSVTILSCISVLGVLLWATKHGHVIVRIVALISFFMVLLNGFLW